MYYAVFCVYQRTVCRSRTKVLASKAYDIQGFGRSEAIIIRFLKCALKSCKVFSALTGKDVSYTKKKKKKPRALYKVGRVKIHSLRTFIVC